MSQRTSSRPKRGKATTPDADNQPPPSGSARGASAAEAIGLASKSARESASELAVETTALHGQSGPVLAPGQPVPGQHDPVPVVVIGAGAAGILAGIFSARSGAGTLVLESRPKPGAKIRVSGGGRCNILPSEVDLKDFRSSGSLRSVRNVLFSWPLKQVRDFFEQDLGIALKIEATGKMFPVSDDSREVVDVLLAGLADSGALLAPGRRVLELRRLDEPNRKAENEPQSASDDPGKPSPEESSPGETGPARFSIALDTGETIRAHSVILASGGLSMPKTGSDGHGLKLAGSLGHDLLPTYPALVPLLSDEPLWKELAGISLNATLQVHRDGRVAAERSGDLLFTHKGFSGPVVLDISEEITGHPDATSEVDLRAAWLGSSAPDWNRGLQAGAGKTASRVLREHLPRRLAEALLWAAEVPESAVAADLRREPRRELLRLLTACPLRLSGDEGYAKAEVTGGGVSLSSVKARTLESRSVPGLYLAGEILDVTGRIGGFNFLWAWTSGRRAGLSAGNRD